MTKTGIFIENARFFNFLEDIIFLKLALLPIYYQCPKRLQSVDDAAETIHIHILIVPEHFGGGVADETQLVLVGSRYVLKQRGKGMAAAVGRVAMADGAVALLQKGARAIGALTAPAGGAGRRRENHHRRDREGGETAERGNGYPHCQGAAHHRRGVMERGLLWTIDRCGWNRSSGCWNWPRRSSYGSFTRRHCT